MGNLTLGSYNKSIISQLGIAGAVNVSETVPSVFQPDAYHIGISYTMRLRINTTSGNKYDYSIPVSASLPLNGTPDLYYAQQGRLRPVTFSSLNNLTSTISNTYASSGNILTYAYGTTYWLPSSSTSGASCSSIPTAFSTAPLASNTIIVTYNAIGLEGCENNYAGLIAYIAPTTLPTVPYLIYPSSSGILADLPSGTKALLYGPGLDTLNIENLRNAVANGYYFASQFTPSYLDRAQAYFNRQSTNGIFTFSNYNRQAGSFNGVSSNVSTALPTTAVNSVSVAVWAYIPSTSDHGAFVKLGSTGSPGSGYGIGVGGSNWDNVGNELWVLFENVRWIDCGTSIGTGWHLAVLVLSSSGVPSCYLDGRLTTTSTGAGAIAPTPAMYIGSDGAYSTRFFTGSLANAQVYSTVLSTQQVQRLYQEGVAGIPLSTAGLVGWWPLNGNANDYSGMGNNGVATSVVYTLLPNYSRDSIMNVPVPTKLAPLPGILGCTSSSSCGSNTIPQLYLGSMPLEAQSGSMQIGNLNGFDNISITTASPLLTGSMATMTVWIKWNGGKHYIGSCCGSRQEVLGADSALGNEVNPIIAVNDSGTNEAETWVCTTSNCWSEAKSAASAIQLNTWYFLASRYNGTAVSLWINGVQVASAAGSGVLSPQGSGTSAYIGSRSNTASYFNGTVADAQMYSTALSTLQIQQLYNEGIAGMPLTGNLVGWWPLNGNANDYSGQGNNGVAIGGVTYPYFFGTYNTPGLSSISTTASEWQALGLLTPQ
jgi:hypothetical protein